MPLPTIRQSVSGTFASGTLSGTLTLSSAPVSGSLLFLLMYGKNNIGLSSVTPVGWVIDKSDQGFSPSVTFQSWGFAHKVAGVSEPTSITVTRTASFDVSFFTLFEIQKVFSWGSLYYAGATTQAAIPFQNWTPTPQPQLIIAGIASGNSGGPQAALNWNGWHQGDVFSNTFHSGENYTGSTLDNLTIPPSFSAGGAEAGVTVIQFLGTHNQPNVCVSIS